MLFVPVIIGCQLLFFFFFSCHKTMCWRQILKHIWRAETVSLVLWHPTTGHNRYKLNAIDQFFFPQIKGEKTTIRKQTNRKQSHSDLWSWVCYLGWAINQRKHFRCLIYQKTGLFFQNLETSVTTTSQNSLNQTNMFNLT